MADGDIILQLGFEGVPNFEMGSCGAALYEAVAPLAHADEQHGWPLARLCEALGRMRQSVSDLVRVWEEDGVDAFDGEGRTRVTATMLRSGWSRAAHPSRGPGRADRPQDEPGNIDLLPFIGQLAGVRGIEQLSNDDRRDAIRHRAGYSRGQRAAILSYADRFMLDRGLVTLRERYDPSLPEDADAPFRGRIIVKRSRIRDLARVNLATNPRAALDTSDLSADGSMQSRTITREPCSWHRGVDHCVRVAGRPITTYVSRLQLRLGDVGRAALPVTAGERYTVSAYVRVTDYWASAAPAGIRWAVQWFDAAGAALAVDTGEDQPDEPDVLAPDTRLSATFQVPEGAAHAQFRLEQGGAELAQLAFEATAILLEQTDELREFGDADTPGWSARGARHRSPSHGPGVDAPDLAARILARIPAGLFYDVVISDQRDWTDVDNTWPTWDDVRTDNATWDDVLVP